MAEEKKKHERLVTPVGIAKWAHVNKPKEGYKKNDKPKYQIDVVFHPDDPEWRAWAGGLMDKVKALPVQKDENTGETAKHKSPIKRELDEDDKPTGRFFVTFKTGEQYKPGVFDKAGEPMVDVLIGNGSKVRVNYSPAEYDGFGGGITLYLNAVQVVELVEYKKQTAEAYGFPVEAKSTSMLGQPPPPPEDDLPF